MRRNAETLLRRALADGAVTVAELEGFGQMEYAGVARILKLDSALNEAVVAVKLQEIGGAALLALEPKDFASALSLTQAQQAERLEAFLSALKEVAADPNGCAQRQQAVAAAADAAAADAAAADPAGTDASTTTKKKRRSDPEAAAAAVPAKRKAPAVPKGLHAPRVSGLKRPPPIVPVAEMTAASETAGVTEPAQHIAKPPVPQEGQGSNCAADSSKKGRQKGEKKQSKATRGRPRRELEVKDQPQMDQQKQQQEAGSTAKDKSHLRAKLMAWAASILGHKGRFDSVLTQQAAYRSKRALLSTTGFPEGAGMQNEVPALLRRLGTLDGVSAAFEWKPQYPEKITHLICSDELVNEVPALLRRLGTLDGVSAAFEWKPQYPEKITHLICSDELVRPTVKLYFALVNGAFILKEEFLQEARKHKAWPDPHQFQRPDFPSVEMREKSRWLLRSMSICIDGPYRPSGLSKQQLQALAVAAGGVLGDGASAAVRILEDAEALRRRQARGLWEVEGEARNQPIAISAQWLLDCIRLWQILPQDQHVLSVSSPPRNNSGGNKTEVAKKTRRNDAKTESNLSKKKKGKGREAQPDRAAEACDAVPHREVSKAQPGGIAALQITVEKPQGELNAPPDVGAAPKENAPNTAHPIHTQQEEGDIPEPNPAQPMAQQAQQEGTAVAKDAAQQTIKKRSTGKRIRSEEKKPHKNAPRRKKLPASSHVNKKQDETVLVDAVDAFPQRGSELAATAGDETRAGSSDAAPTSEPQSHLTEKPAEGTPGGDGNCSENDDGLAASPTVGDWEPPEESPPPEDRAEEAVATSAAVPAAEATTDSPQRDCPASTSKVAAAGDSLQLSGEHLDVAGLFEPDETDAAEYNFDIKDHCSLGQKFEDVHVNGPANTQREAVCESHLNENMPNNNGKETVEQL
ncbi:hypothetical protein, conserved [Eimeria praecox]|uniref:BRCT domain-containing protein n=1 Tax=Eimeria praecox TaxID=51316 RepID=U6G472_9EIME|nr:hypothetical protein, conserved [Eimeria praecox]